MGHRYQIPSRARPLFAKLTQEQIRRGVHRSTRELETAIRDYLRVYKLNPKP